MLDTEATVSAAVATVGSVWDGGGDRSTFIRSRLLELLELATIGGGAGTSGTVETADCGTG